ncbi:hypothetical protein MMC25_000633 [Agyrium rufum]|nr:hypothetical protein [Agyrium rufum]
MPSLLDGLRIGNDICSIQRIKKIIRRDANGEYLTRWVHKFLRKKECEDFERLKQRWLDPPPDTPSTRLNNYLESAVPLHMHSGQQSLHFNRLAAFLAGRWAAKEAIIKAHALYKIRQSDISISVHPLGGQPTAKVLIGATVLMGKQVAVQRSIGPSIGPMNQAAQSYFQGITGCAQSELEHVRARPMRIDLRNWHTTHLSISHDTDYATAVCLAEYDFSRRYVIDDGSGPLLHIPARSDQGFAPDSKAFENEESGEPNEDVREGDSYRKLVPDEELSAMH